MMMIMIVIILLHKSERGNSKAQMQPKTGRREQIPGRGKEYILGCLHFGKKKSRKFCFLEELILSKVYGIFERGKIPGILVRGEKVPSSIPAVPHPA